MVRGVALQAVAVAAVALTCATAVRCSVLLDEARGMLTRHCAQKERCAQRHPSKVATAPEDFFHATLPAVPCFCDENCHTFQDCCYDLAANATQPADQETTLGFPSTAWSCQNLTRPQVASDRTTARFAWMVSRCPEEADDGMAAQCASLAPDRTYIHDLPIIAGGVMFRNIYCAGCYGMTYNDLFPLNLEISCQAKHLTSQDLINATYVPGELRFVLEDSTSCDLEIRQLKNISGFNSILKENNSPPLRLCREGLIGWCPDDWDDEDVRLKCSEYIMIVQEMESKNIQTKEIMACALGYSDGEAEASKENVEEFDWDIIFVVDFKRDWTNKVAVAEQERILGSTDVLSKTSEKAARMVARTEKRTSDNVRVLRHTKFPPQVLKAVIELTHEGTFSMPLPIDLQDAELFAKAAIFFDLPALIEKVVSVKSVWLILDTLFIYGGYNPYLPQMKNHCKSVLVSAADVCLRDSTFYTISLPTLKFFMGLGSISVRSDVLKKVCEKKLKRRFSKKHYIRRAKNPNMKEFLQLVLSNLNRLCPFPVTVTNLANYTVYFQGAFHFDTVPKEEIQKQHNEKSICYQVGENPEMLCLKFKVCTDIHLLGIELFSRKKIDASSAKLGYHEQLEIQVISRKDENALGLIHHQGKVSGRKEFDSCYSVLFPYRLFLSAGSQWEIGVMVQEGIQLPLLGKSCVPSRFLTGRGLLCLDDAKIITKEKGGADWVDSKKEANCIISKVCFDLARL